MIPALAFVNPNNVVAAYEELMEHPDFPADALPIALFFEDNYIGRMIPRRGRVAARFPIAVWNMYERTLLGQQRTNNNVEGMLRKYIESSMHQKAEYSYDP